MKKTKDANKRLVESFVRWFNWFCWICPALKIHLAEFNMDLDKYGNTFLLNILRIEINDPEASFLEIGWYQGDFCFDILWAKAIQRTYETWRDNRDV